MSYEALPRPNPGKLADAVSRLAGEMLTEISDDDDRISVDDCLEMLTTCPPIMAAVDAKILLALSLWGPYEHADEDAQRFIRTNLECMQGSFEIALAEVYASLPLGWVASEIAWRQEGAQPASLRLESLMALDPRMYSFRGRRSQIEDVYYRSEGGDVAIDYQTKILHVVNKPYLTFGNPTGIADCRLASAAWRAWKIVVSEALLAGQRQATPILAGTSPDATVALLRADGQPMLNDQRQEVRVPATQAMAEALEKVSTNASYLSLVQGSEVKALNAQTDGEFFMKLLEYFQRLMFMAFMVPETLFSVGRGGLGNAGLAASHSEIMVQQLRVITRQIQDQMKEKLVRQLLRWEYGEPEDLGMWAQPEQTDEDRLALFSSITDAIARGAFSSADIEVVNRHRTLAGIPPIAEIAARITPTTYEQPEAA